MQDDIRLTLGLKALGFNVFNPVESTSLFQKFWFQFVNLHPYTAGRLVDVGPSADAGAEAKAFRAFWVRRCRLNTSG